MKRIQLLIAITIVAFQSCTVKVSPSDVSWNPYEVGDTFTFESETGDSKSFEISNIETQEVKENVYAGNLSRKKENIVVFAKQTNPQASEPFALLVIASDVDSDTSLGLALAIPDQLEANYIDDIPKLTPNSSLTIKGIVYENVIEVNPNLQVGEGVNIPYPVKLYFSKEVGYLGYDLSNGEKWRLR